MNCQQTLNVRKMTESDLDTVYAIESDAHITPWGRDVIRDCIIVGYDCIVLELQEDSSSTIAGYIIARHGDTICHILNLCIAKSLQGKGYGRSLMSSYLSSLELQEHVHSAVLEVRPSNHIAIHLYDTLGFIKVSYKNDYYKDADGTEDAVVLEKKLVK